MALATRDDLLREVRERTRREIEEHECSKPAWVRSDSATRDETANCAAELLKYVDPTDLKPVARRYC
jgi:hypothetical protein